MEDLFAAFSQCAAAFPSSTTEDQDDDGMIFAEADGDDDVEGAEDGEGLTEAGRVRADFSTPSARFNPY